ncbi:MAG: flagellar protein FlaG [Spirochaetales bacterium]|nr:flagellar protein FlaG [Spirochaetales bacterium]
MELDIHGLSTYDTAKVYQQKQQKSNNATAEKIKREKDEKIQEITQEQLATDSRVDSERYLKNILKMTEFYNKELRYSIDRELDQVIVKVVNSQTDKVIKEIPPEELQRLYRSMKEALGQLIDEQM